MGDASEDRDVRGRREKPPRPDRDDPPPLGSDGARARRSDGDDPSLLPANRFQRLLTVALLGALVLASAGVVAVAVAPPETADPFTEFYVVGENGTATAYPTVVAPGDDVTVTIGVENHEHEQVTYGLVGAWNGSQTLERNVTVDDEGADVRDVTVTAPDEPGPYRLQYRLYGGSGEDGPQTLRLWVRVSA